MNIINNCFISYQNASNTKKCGIIFGSLLSIFSAAYVVYRLREQRLQFNAFSSAEFVARNIDLHGKYAIVTGANAGIGKETALILLKHGCTVILACRNISKAKRAKQWLLKHSSFSSDFETENEFVSKNATSVFTNDRIKIIIIDLSSLKSIQLFCKIYASFGWPLHYLINNAAIVPGDFQETEEEIEMQFGVNYIGHWYLTHLLLPQLCSSKGRIINISSVVHVCCSISMMKSLLSSTNGNNPLSEEKYSSLFNYALSKACLILFAREFHKRYSDKGIFSVSVHPGFVKTQISQSATFAEKCVAFLLNSSFMGSTMNQATATIMRCVCMADDEIEGGAFYANCRESNHQLFTACKITAKNVFQEELWDFTQELIVSKGFPL